MHVARSLEMFTGVRNAQAGRVVPMHDFSLSGDCKMKPLIGITGASLKMIVAAGVFSLAACAGTGGGARHSQMMLSGSQEVPPVSTAPSGSGTITVNTDKSVSGSVTTSGINAIAAHIHTGAPGQNGPVIIPLTQSGNTWSVPAGASLTDAQYDLYKAGNLYVNVHSAANKGGEIRGQLKP